MKFNKYDDLSIKVAEDATPKVLLAHRVTLADLDGYKKATGWFGAHCRFAYTNIVPKFGDYLVKYEGENEGTKIVTLISSKRFVELTGAEL